MNDRLDRALSDLPRHRAGQDFTERLDARLDSAAPRHRRPGRPLAWALATILAIAGASALLIPPEGGKASPFAATDQSEETQIQEMQIETQQLSHELAELRGLVEEAEPVIYLGGDEYLGILLRHQALRGTVATPVRVLPATASTSNRL